MTVSRIFTFQSAMRESFKFTNIYPEYKNNKMWASVEVYIRKKVLKDFQEVRIFIVPAFRSKDSDPFVTYSVSVFVLSNMFYETT